MIALWTGRQPTKRTHEMLCDVMQGWAPSTNWRPTWRSSNAPTNRPRKKTDRLTPLEPPPNPSDRDSNSTQREDDEIVLHERQTGRIGIASIATTDTIRNVGTEVAVDSVFADFVNATTQRFMA